MSMNKQELERFVKRVVDDFPHKSGYPSNIIDHVFLAIEQNAVFLRRYEQLVASAENGKHSINPWIGKLVKQYTNMESDKEHTPAQLSRLIETYTELK